MWHTQALFCPALLVQSHLACMAAAVLFLWLKLRTCSGRGRHAGNTCWVHYLCFSPCFHLSAPSLSTSLHLSPESVMAVSFICIYFPLPSPSTPSHPLGFTLPSLHPCFLASPLCPITGVTLELSKHSLRCWSTLHAVMCHLCITQGVVRMILLGWRVLPEDILFTLFVFTKMKTYSLCLKSHVLYPTNKNCALQKDPSHFY